MSELALPCQVAGYFKLEAFREDADGNEIPGSRRVAADWFPNLITDAGLEAMGTSAIVSLLAFCRVGSGTATPTVADTALASFVAATNTVQSDTSGNTTSAPYYGWRRVVRRFAAGVAAGNLSEVGMATAASGGTLFSRALILDGGGSPTTITVLSDEVLDVTYELRNYVPTDDTAWGINISGVAYSGTMRAARATNSTWSLESASAAGGGNGVNSIAATNGSIGAITSQPSGTTASVGSTNAAYTGGSKVRDFTGTFGLNDANLAGGITALEVRTSYGYFQFSVSPAIPKDATKTLQLTFRCGPWGRFTP